MEYTEKIHAEGLLEILSDAASDLCHRCPVGLIRWKYKMGSWSNERDVCDICWGFIGYSCGWTCPCIGLKECSKLTWLALEAKGYLE